MSLDGSRTAAEEMQQGIVSPAQRTRKIVNIWEKKAGKSLSQPVFFLVAQAVAACQVCFERHSALQGSLWTNQNWIQWGAGAPPVPISRGMGPGGLPGTAFGAQSKRWGPQRPWQLQQELRAWGKAVTGSCGFAKCKKCKDARCCLLSALLVPFGWKQGGASLWTPNSRVTGTSQSQFWRPHQQGALTAGMSSQQRSPGRQG